MPRPSLLAALLVTGINVLSAQQRPPDSQNASAVPSGAITGTIVDGDTGAPISEAIVQLGGPPSSKVLSDSKGRFVFAGLPPGGYQVMAEKLGYFPGLLGNPEPLTTSAIYTLGTISVTKLVRLGENEWVANATIKLWRPGAIDGVVRDEHGDPLVGRFVRVLAAEQNRQFEPFQFIAAGTTDDRGVFSIGRLPPGPYVVGMHAVDSDLALAPTTDAMVYPAIYYPATRSLRDAIPVSVTGGRTTSGVLLNATVSIGRVIAGRVEGPAEARTNLRLILTNADDVFVGTTSQVARASVRADGTFSFPPVASGHYLLTSTAAGAPEEWPPPPSSVCCGPRPWDLPTWGRGEPSRYSARTNVSVADRDILDLVLPLTRGVTVKGTIRADQPDDPARSFPFSITAEPVEAAPGVGPRGHGMLWAPAFGQPRGPIAFEITGLTPAKYVLTAGRGPVQKITAGGVDLTGRVLDLTSGADVADVEVVVTVGPKVSGRVHRPDRTATEPATVMYFPVDPAFWAAGSGSPRTGSIDVRIDGSYETIAPIPPGRYWFVAAPADLLNSARTPELLAAAAKVATQVELGRGEVRSLDLDVVQVKR